MKNLKIFSIIMAFIFCANAKSQIQVLSTGLVGVGGITPNTNLQVGSNTGYNSCTGSFGADLRICSYNSTNTWRFFLLGTTVVGIIRHVVSYRSAGSIVQNMYLTPRDIGYWIWNGNPAYTLGDK